MRIFNRTPAYTPAAVSYPTLGVDALKAMFRVMPEAQLKQELKAALTMHAGASKSQASAGLNTLLAMAQLYKEAVHVTDGALACMMCHRAPRDAAMAFVDGRSITANMPIPGHKFPEMPGSTVAKRARLEQAADVGKVRFAPTPLPAAPKPPKGILKNASR